MARFAIDTQTTLWRTYEVDADTMEEAMEKLQARFDRDENFLVDHFVDLKDHTKTDWLPENIELHPYTELGDGESGYPKA